jgi:hypothetical protein
MPVKMLSPSAMFIANNMVVSNVAGGCSLLPGANPSSIANVAGASTKLKGMAAADSAAEQQTLSTEPIANTC